MTPRFVKWFWGQVLALLVALSVMGVATVFLTPVFSELEGRLLPVTTKLQAFNKESDGKNTAFYVSFEKVRQCEFVGISWYNSRGERIALDFLEEVNAPDNRPVGRQLTGPWRLHWPTLSGTYAVVEHHCHGLWQTTTQIYP